MDFDDILKDVEEFGTYQRLMLAFVLLPGFVPCGFHAYNQLFMAATPDHHCRPSPYLMKINMTEDLLLNLSIPYEENGGQTLVSQCKMYDLDPQAVELLYPENSHDNSNTSKISCQHGWIYDHSVYKSTVVTEWDLVCDKDFYPTLALFLLGLGGLVGNYIFGWLQDSAGRRPSFFLYLGIQCVFGIATGFAYNFWTWLVMRIGVGFTVPAITGTPFVLSLELVGAEQRTLCTILLNISYSLCLMALPVVAYFVRDWRHLAFATTLPFLSFFAFWWVMPESPRWLFAHGKLKETEKILRRIAQVNGKKLPENYSEILEEKYLEMRAESGEQDVRHDYNILDLLKGPVLRKNTLIITFIWFINMGVYVGLSYYAPALGGDEYFNFFIAGAAELPTYLFLFPCLNHAGRRWTLFGSMLLGGVACICTILVKNDAWITLSLYSIGKFGISAGFVAIQQIAAEIYPTVVRGLGISFSNVVGMIGPALVPLVNYTGKDNLTLPLLILGFLMVIGGVVALLLPETLGRPLPQTLEDAELFQMELGLDNCLFPKKLQTRVDVIEMKEISTENKEEMVESHASAEHQRPLMFAKGGGDMRKLSNSFL